MLVRKKTYQNALNIIGDMTEKNKQLQSNLNVAHLENEQLEQECSKLLGQLQKAKAKIEHLKHGNMFTVANVEHIDFGQQPRVHYTHHHIIPIKARQIIHFRDQTPKEYIQKLLAGKLVDHIIEEQLVTFDVEADDPRMSRNERVMTAEIKIVKMEDGNE